MTITKRLVESNLEEMLVNNEPFLYAHLIKFERPSRPDTTTGLVSTSKQRYTYLTDASINVTYDDGSTDLSGVPNGPQIYLANKVLSVGSVTEQTKATTSTTSLVLDGNAIGAYISATVTITSVNSTTWDIVWPNIDDVLLQGFREGDKVVISISATDYKVNISSFRSSNTLRVTKVDDTLPTGSSTVTMSLASEEIISILMDKTLPEYASFVNREVFIYRAYFQEGSIVGTPILLFKGIIYSVSFEDAENSVKVNWGLTSHWGDFSQVRGRITSDGFHRALDQNGSPQPLSALKPLYAYDKGFNHAETSINMLATYSVQVEKQAIKTKKGVFGVGAKVKVKKYFVAEERNTDLDFQLQAKSIPLIYGVRNTEGTPIFADTLASDNSTVFVASVLSEGEIGGIYDVYIEGNSLICNDKADYDARYKQTSDNTVELICRGRADRGDALGGEVSSNLSFIALTASDMSLNNEALRNFIIKRFATGYLPPTLVDTIGSTTPISESHYSTHGVLDGESIALKEPQEITIDFFAGKPGQKAAPQLVQIANDPVVENRFKIQNSYWEGTDTTEYWGPNHRLLDTAYVVTKVKIAEGQTTIPELEFIVRGKVLDCYNYDYSYKRYSSLEPVFKGTIKNGTTLTVSKVYNSGTVAVGQYLVGDNIIPGTRITGSTNATTFTINNSHSSITVNRIAGYTENHTAFKIGQRVRLYRSDTNALINGSDTVQIIDKWSFRNPDGSLNVRFRYNVVPDLNYSSAGIPGITKFYMRPLDFNSGAEDTSTRWTMTTFNHTEYTGVVTEEVTSLLTSKTTSSGNIVLNFTSKTSMSIEGDPEETTPAYAIVKKELDNTYSPVSTGNLFDGALIVGTAATSSSVTTMYADSVYGSEAASLANGTTYYLASKNTIKLPASASGTNNIYTGLMIDVTRYSSTTGKSTVQTAEIIGYDGTNKIATIDTIWDLVPIIGDTVRIYPKYSDSRVSINPAIQSLDYITSKTYGRGLNPYKDLDLPSWLETARKCDTRSDVTILVTSGTLPTAGDIYKYPSSGPITWQGEVKSVSGQYVTFTNVIGKITNKWNSWKSWSVNDIVYHNNNVYSVSAEGVRATEPVHTTGADGTFTFLSSFTLSKVSGAGGNLTITGGTSGNPVKALRNGQTISGYSLYDCDDINYWRLTGWDEHAQRYVTKHQTNLVIDTSAPLFDNMNSLLEHFGGILRYTSGKYSLDVEDVEPDIDPSDIRTVTVDDIVGKIQLSDEGTRSAFNSLTAAFADPANKFEARNVSFFNSDYLKADRNVPKKGNLSIPGITNYYNTRLLADSYLNKSRYGLTLNMTVRYHGILLLAGTVIQVPYARYSWDNKKFRIESITYEPNGMVNLVAKEYDPSFYGLTNIRKAGGTGATTQPGVVVVPEGRGPINLSASTDQYNQILLTWENGADTGLTSTYTEIWRSDINDFNSASIIALVPVVPGVVNQYIDPISPVAGGVSAITKYYWVRHKVIKQ